MSFEVEIPRQFIRKSIRICVILVFVIGFILIGWSVSPNGINGFPLILTPRILAITTYYQEGQQWINEISEIHEQLLFLLTNPASSLLSKDMVIDHLIGEVQSLELDIDGSHVPPTMETVQNGFLECLSQTLTTIETISLWILDPSENNLVAARQSLTYAEEMLNQLTRSSWVEWQP